MRTHQASSQKSAAQKTTPSATDFLAPRPFAAPSHPVTEPQPATETRRSFLERPGLFNPGPERLLPIQPKLTLGQPNDKYEQEADRMAQQVVAQIHTFPAASPNPQPSLQRQETLEDEELQMKPVAHQIQRLEMPDEDELQMKPLAHQIQRLEMPDEDELQMKPGGARSPNGPMAVSANLESAIAQARGSGQPLSDNIRQPMEQAFGADFGGVRVHTGPQSDQLNRSIQARAFTTGQDVFFRQGEYNPGSRGGQELLAHELTHVVQQAGLKGISRKLSVKSINGATNQVKSREPAGLIQRKVTLEFSDESIPLTTKIADIKVDRPSNPLKQYTEKYGSGNKDDELRHRQAWLEYERGIEERVKGKTIRKACQNYELEESAWSVGKLKTAIQDGANKFMNDLSNFDWGPKLANNKTGSAAPHATDEAITGVKKRKMNTLDKPKDEDFNKSVEKSQFFNFDFVSSNTSEPNEQKRIVKEAKRKRRKSQKLLGEAAKLATGEKVRVRNMVNMPKEYREDYLGKRGKGVKGWEPKMIIRVPEFEDMSDTQVSDLEDSASEGEYFSELAPLDYMQDITEPKAELKLPSKEEEKDKN